MSSKPYFNGRLEETEEQKGTHLFGEKKWKTCDIGLLGRGSCFLKFFEEPKFKQDIIAG
jgi:hypothetical protein